MAIQQKLMQTVAHDTGLQQQAMDAFRSSVRAYATHSSNVKHIFHIKQLHLGHVAYSFALKGTPSLIGTQGTTSTRKRKKLEDRKQQVQQAKKEYRKAVAE